MIELHSQGKLVELCQACLLEEDDKIAPKPTPVPPLLSRSDASISIENSDISAPLDALYLKMVQKNSGVLKRKRSILGGKPTGVKGSELVHWILKNIGCSKTEATELVAQLLQAQYLQCIKGLSSQPGSESSVFRFTEHADSSILNMRRAWTGFARSPQLVVEDISKLLLHCKQNFWIPVDENICIARLTFDYDSFFDSTLYNTFCNKILELQRIDMSDLTEKALVALFVNIYNIMLFHFIGLFGTPDSYSKKQLLFHQSFYLIQSMKFSLTDIEHGILRANKRPPGRFRKHLSKNDPRSYLGARIKFDPRVHFLLLDVSFGSTSTAFSTLTEDNIEMAMQYTTSTFCEIEVELEEGSNVVLLPGLFAWYATDFGATWTDRLAWISAHLPEASHKKQILNELIATTHFEVQFKTTNWDRNFRFFGSEVVNQADQQNMILEDARSKIKEIKEKKDTSVTLTAGQLQEVPEMLCKLKQLETINLSRNNLKTIPAAFGKLILLKSVEFSDNHLQSLPKELCSLSLLENLNISYNDFEVIPSCIYMLSSLTKLNLEFNKIQAIGEEEGCDSFQTLSKLQVLNLSKNSLSKLPPSLPNSLAQLTSLDISYNKFKRLPKLPACLRCLYAQANQISKLDETINFYVHLRELDAADNSIAEIPKLKLEKLESLNLSSNCLTNIIDIFDASSLFSLHTIELNGNRIKGIPPALLRNSTKLLTFLRNGSNVAPSIGATPRAVFARGASINDLILAGSPELGKSNRSTNIARAASNRAGAMNSKCPLLILPCKGYSLETGEERTRAFMSSTASIARNNNSQLSLQSDLLLAHSNFFYRDNFVRQRIPHITFFSKDEGIGFVLLNVATLPINDYLQVLARTETGDKMVNVPESLIKRKKDKKDSPYTVKELAKPIMDFFAVQSLQEIPEDCTEDLLALEVSLTVINHKVGVLYAEAGQQQEDDFYNNEHGSTEFKQFLKVLGETIKLKGWTEFAGGLDTEQDRTGTHSVFTEYYSGQIMYHVAPLLPYKDSTQQQIERKCHLGNDIIMVLFVDKPSFYFTPLCIASQFNSAFIVVCREPHETKELYRVNITSKREMGIVAPKLPNPPVFNAEDLRRFLLTKITNLEEVAWTKLSSFAGAVKRARQIYMSNLFEKYEPICKKKGLYKTKKR